jgi:hypothetical protein
LDHPSMQYWRHSNSIVIWIINLKAWTRL